MNIQEIKQTLCGPMIPVITNLKSDLNIDPDAIKTNVNYVVERGITTGSGVLLAVGAGGDFPMLSPEERKQASAAILDAASGRVPVLIGAQDTNPQVSLELALFADNIGAYGIQLAPTYYYHPSDDDVFELFERIHNSTNDIAIMIYNTWWHGYNMSMDMVERLSKLERVVSVKWSTPDGGRSYVAGIAHFSDRLAMVDNQGLPVLNRMLGGSGYVTHLATIWPEHDIAVWNMMQNGDFHDALKEFMRVNWPWMDFRSKISRKTGGEANTVKAALEIRGRPGGPCRPPTRGLDREERRELRDVLSHICVPGL